MRYIATREGVEKLAGNSAVTKGQRELIQKLLHDFPDAVQNAHAWYGFRIHHHGVGC